MIDVGDYVVSNVTTSPGKDFGLKAGKVYLVTGIPFNAGSGVIFVNDDFSCPWAESYFTKLPHSLVGERLTDDDSIALTTMFKRPKP